MFDLMVGLEVTPLVGSPSVMKTTMAWVLLGRRPTLSLFSLANSRPLSIPLLMLVPPFASREFVKAIATSRLFRVACIMFWFEASRLLLIGTISFDDQI